jgi:hypothetical protein
MHVRSEKDGSTILESKVYSDRQYKLQQGYYQFFLSFFFPSIIPPKLIKQIDTLILWSESESGEELALSFQEAVGCAEVW